ncbi:MAG: N-acetyltransferase [Bryobacterales bacterium]|nr:N-acetyltransferase [Bryobacteraceae bacterium]MDW8131647.1 N-acetyltransferase [Bryobacterales bacterium]
MRTSPRTVAAPLQACRLRLEKAVSADIPDLLRLINGYAAQGIMLPRTELELAENLRDFTVVRENGRVLACAALHIYSPASAEIRSLAVEPAAQGRGLGRALVLALEQEARDLGLQTVFAFTYIPDFFRKLGYRQVERSELPLKAWKDCLRCPKFQCCDEIPVLKSLSG